MNAAPNMLFSGKVIFAARILAASIAFAHQPVLAAKPTITLPPIELDIPAQSLQSALIQLAIQSQSSIIAPTNLVDGKTTQAIKGRYQLEQALRQILGDNNLRYRFSEDRRSVSIIAAPKKATPEPPPNQPEAPRQQIFEQLVTVGSRLPRSRIGHPLNSITPVSSIHFDNTAANGTVSITDTIRDLTINNGSAFINEQNNLAGTVQFNIRGIGFASTLALINGRRSGKSGLSDNGGAFFFDISHIPLNMISRIDVQKDGASAIYGSEAVGGVVNIVTRKGFSGLELSGSYTDASNESGNVSLALGDWEDESGYNLYINYFRQNRNNRTDFPWLTERLSHTDDLQNTVLASAAGSPGTYRQATFNTDTGLASEVASELAFPDPDCIEAGGVLRNSNCLHIFADQNSVLHEKRQLQIFAEANYQLNDATLIFTEVGFNNGRINRTRGPGNFNNGLVADSGRIFIPSDHPFNFFTAGSQPGELIYIDPSQWDNAIHNAVDLSCQCRVLGNEFNGVNSPEDRISDNDFARALIGIEYELGDSISFSASYLYSSSQWDLSTPFNYSAPVVNQLILNGRFNPFGTRIASPELISPKDNISRAGLSDDVFEVLRERDNTSTRQDQQVVDISITGEAFSLPAGTAGFALGTQLRREDFTLLNDPKRLNGTGGLRGTLNNISGQQRSWAYFAELMIPAASTLDIQLALRGENYNLESASDIGPKVAMRWEAQPWLALRGSFSRSFQAPSLRQISEARSASIINDPARPNPVTGELECTDSSRGGNTSSRTVGDPDLNSQLARNLSFGAVFTPTDESHIVLDYWQIDYRDLIVQDEGASQIVTNDCLDDGIPNDPRIERSAGGNILLVTSNFINSGELLASGFDISARHTATLSGGELELGLEASLVDEFLFDPANGDPIVNGAGSRNSLNRFSSVPELRANASLHWHSDYIYSSATLRYISDYENDQDNNSRIPSFVTLDLQFGVQIPSEFGDSQITLGINNVADRDPPSLGINQRPGYDPAVHDIRGRQLLVAFKHKF
ncbi:TonB-dependent receptor [bacterium SCSIO 12696]|nr:TonB-dependent receptor [bacterium SCSIO 12696]